MAIRNNKYTFHKMKRIIILVLTATLLTANAVAQKNVQRAFDKFINSKKVQVEKSVSSQYDPFPSGKKGEHLLLAQRDIYAFTLNARDRSLLDKILIQMEEDRTMPPCYTVKSHRGGNNTPIERWNCCVGNDDNNAVPIGRDTMDNWMLACYTADDEAYRHLYAVEWQESAEGNEIKGRLIYTYAKRRVEGGKLVDRRVGKAEAFETEEEFVLRFTIAKDDYLSFLNEAGKQLSKEESRQALLHTYAIFLICRDNGHLVKGEEWRRTIKEEVRKLIVKTGERSEDAKWCLQHALLELEKQGMQK